MPYNFAFKVILVSFHIKITMAAQVEQDRFAFTFTFAALRFLDGSGNAMRCFGAGIIPSALANLIPASKTSRLSCALASISPSFNNWLTIAPAPW